MRRDFLRAAACDAPAGQAQPEQRPHADAADAVDRARLGSRRCLSHGAAAACRAHTGGRNTADRGIGEAEPTLALVQLCGTTFACRYARGGQRRGNEEERIACTNCTSCASTARSCSSGLNVVTLSCSNLWITACCAHRTWQGSPRCIRHSRKRTAIPRARKVLIDMLLEDILEAGGPRPGARDALALAALMVSTPPSSTSIWARSRATWPPASWPARSGLRVHHRLCPAQRSSLGRRAVPRQPFTAYAIRSMGGNAD